MNCANLPYLKIADIIDNLEFLEKVQSKTGITNLQFVTEVDTNRLSLLYYKDEGMELIGMWMVLFILKTAGQEY